MAFEKKRRVAIGGVLSWPSGNSWAVRKKPRNAAVSLPSRDCLSEVKMETVTTNTEANTIEPLLLTPRDAAKALSVCERTLYALTAPRGDIRVIRVGKNIVRYAVEDLRAWARRKSLENSHKALDIMSDR